MSAFTTLVVLLAGGPACLAGPSGVDLRETAPAGAGQNSKRAGERRLRCWQEGRLIYENRGVIAIDKSAGVTEFKCQGPKDAGVEVVDMKHGLCILESAGKR